MTPAQAVKSYGIKNITEAAKQYDCSTTFLRKCYHEKPKKFRIIMQGLAVELGLYEVEVKINNEEWVKK